MEEGKERSFNLDEILDEVSDEETDMDKMMKLMLDPSNIEHNSELSDNEITAFSILGPMAEKYNLIPLKSYLERKLRLRVSKKRSGRMEWVKILARRAQQVDDEEKKRGSVWRRLG